MTTYLNSGIKSLKSLAQYTRSMFINESMLTDMSIDLDKISRCVLIESKSIIEKNGKPIDAEKVKAELLKMNKCRCSYTKYVSGSKYVLYLEFNDGNIRIIPISDDGKYLGCEMAMFGYNNWYYLDNEEIGNNIINLASN